MYDIFISTNSSIMISYEALRPDRGDKTKTWKPEDTFAWHGLLHRELHETQLLYFRPNEPSLIFYNFPQIIRKVYLFWPFMSIYLKSKVIRRFPFLQNKTELFLQEGKSLNIQYHDPNLASTGFPHVAWEKIFTSLLKGKVKPLCLLRGQNLQQSS